MSSYKKWLRKKVVPGLIAVTMTFSLGTMVNANEIQNESNGQEQATSVAKFTDVKNHGARDAIERMAEYGFISGYPDSTFRPNEPVTKIQSVKIVMSVLKQKSDQLLTEGDDYIGAGVPDWAKDYVELALFNDIAEWEEILPFNEDATRISVVNLLANALGIDATESDINSLSFTDTAGLSSKEIANLAVAVKYNLVSGYPNNTFKPNDSVTRSQMALFVSRLYDKLEAEGDNANNEVQRYEVVKGTISSINENGRKLTIGSTIFNVSDKVTVKINNESANLVDLKTKMNVQAVIQDNKIVEIYVNSSITDEETNENTIAFDRVVTGTISDVSSNSKELKVDSKTFNVSKNVFIQINGKLADFNYLEKEMQVVIIIKKDQIESIYAFSNENTQPSLEFMIKEDSDDSFNEAKLTGDRVSDLTPDLATGDLSIRVNSGSWKDIDLKKIDGDQKSGNEVAEELEEAIEDALNDNLIKVTFDSNRNRFIIESKSSSTNKIPSLQFRGDDKVLDALGIDDDLVKGSSAKVAWKITVKSDAKKDETYLIRIEAEDEDLDEKVIFSVEKGDTAEEIADTIADILEDNSDIKSIFDIDADNEEVILTPDDEDLDDVKIEIEVR